MWNNENAEIWQQKCLIWVFFGKNFQKYFCLIWSQHFRICLIANFFEETKMPKFGTKMPFLRIFGRNCYILIFLGKNFWKNYCHIWNKHPWISLIAKHLEIIKMPKFGTKLVLFCVFWDRILKKFCHIWNPHLWISVIPKFSEEEKIPKFATKKALFGYFWPTMPYLCIFEQEFKKNICHIGNYHPQICLIGNFHEKTKMCHLDIFGL